MTSILLLALLAVIVGGLLVGNEIAVGWFVHPKLWTLDDSSHLRAAQPLARVYGKVMPFWYALALLTFGGLAYALRKIADATPFWLAVAGAALWLLTIVYTLLGPAPINSRVANWNVTNPPADWQAQRRRWDYLHRFRVIAIVLALLLITMAALSGVAAYRHQ